jgi:hypothetical protein
VVSSRRLTEAIAAVLRMGGAAEGIDAIVVRTLPNDPAPKREKDWSSTNPPFLTSEAAHAVVDGAPLRVRHLLVDLPSIDREDDGGALLAHRAVFFDANGAPTTRSVTEICFVPSDAPDGAYCLVLGVAPIEADAAPSRPMLVPLRKDA